MKISRYGLRIWQTNRIWQTKHACPAEKLASCHSWCYVASNNKTSTKKKISSNSLQRWIEKERNTYKKFKSTIIKYTMRTTLFPRACLMSVKKQEFSLDVSDLAALQQYSFAVTVLPGPWNQQVCWDESSPVYCQGADVPVCESLHRLTYLERLSKKNLHQKFEVARGKSWQRPASATVIALCSWENISCLHFLV